MTLRSDAGATVDNAESATLGQLRLATDRCISEILEKGALSESSADALVSTLLVVQDSFAGAEWISKQVVRELVEIYPRVLGAVLESKRPDGAHKSIANLARIENAVVNTVASRGEIADYGELQTIIHDLSEFAGDVYVPIRMLDGIDSDAVAAFQKAIADANARIRSLRVLPRPLAEVFVSIYSTVDLQSHSPYYGSRESAEIQKAGTIILNAVRETLRD